MPDKNSQNTHPVAPPVPGSIVNNQSSIINTQSPPTRYFPRIRYPRSSFRLLSSVFCLLPIPPIFPLVFLALIPCALPPFVPSWLRGYKSIMQNKPNFQNKKNAATSYAAQIYTYIPLHSAPKKQTQTNPIHHGQAPGQAGFVASHPRAKPDSSRRSSRPNRNIPNLSRRSPERSRIPAPRRFTLHEIRHTTSDIRHTNIESPAHLRLAITPQNRYLAAT